MGSITFNGISTESFGGVVIQAPPLYEFPSKDIQSAKIQGRNGDIIIDRNSYRNVIREYNVASVVGDGETFVSIARELVDWLSSVSGYAELEDTYEPDYFRLAIYRSGGRLPNFYDKATAINIKFECKPQRFLKTGKTSVPITAGSWVEIVNPTQYIALPELTFSGTDVEVKVSQVNGGDVDNDSVISISGAVTNAIVDSDLQDCYDSSEYLNNRATLTNGFPKLYPGSNWIFVSAGATLTIKPRWWVL